MNSKNIVACAAALAASALGAAPALAAAAIEGRWVTEERDAVVEIGDCGNATCGRIVQFLVAPPQGRDQRDINNPDPELRNRRLLGLPVLSRFREEEDLWRGRIYDPKSGKDYRSVIRRKGPDRLEVKGCIGPFCRTQIWRRAT